MASDEIYSYTVTVPAGTTQASPAVFPTVFPGRIVDRIEYRLSAGGLNVVGFQVGMRGVSIVPRNPGGFIMPTTVSGGWDMANQPTSGDWSVTAFNTGVYPHGITIAFYTRLIPRPEPDPYQLAPDDLTELPEPDYTGA